MATANAKLDVSSRSAEGSRAARRLRRTGRVPGVLYGGGEQAVGFDVDARELRVALQGSGAVLDLALDGAKTTPVVVKDIQRDPVRGQTTHVDLLRVRLDKAIHAVVALELTGADGSPGVKQGGILEHLVREVNIEALPSDIPEAIVCDVSSIDIGDTLTGGSIVPPDGVTLLDDPETVIATVSAPRLQAQLEAEIEGETELVGEAAGGEGEQSGGE